MPLTDEKIGYSEILARVEIRKIWKNRGNRRNEETWENGNQVMAWFGPYVTDT